MLPPLITEEELCKSIGEQHLSHVLWKSFEMGKRYKGESKPSKNSRCYLQLDSAHHTELFVKEYHGQKFVDDRGEEFRAVVCYAPYQKVPRVTTQKDSREGAIEEDSTYLEFVEKLSETKGAYVAPPNLALVRPADPADTPLLHYLKNKVIEKRSRAEKKEKKRWREGTEQEAPKKAKWHCSNCGTSKHLEEDPDDRGTFYCGRCWESWESSAAAPAKSKKKKKKKDKVDEEPVYEEDTKRNRKKKDKKETEWAAAEWESEWHAKEPSKPSKAKKEVEEEDDAEARRRRRKKKEEAEWAEDYSQSKWHSKRGDTWSEADSQWWSEEKDKSSKREKEKKEKGDRDRRSEKDKGERNESRGIWRAKDAAEEEKPRRSKKDREEEDHWVPKSRSKA